MCSLHVADSSVTLHRKAQLLFTGALEKVAGFTDSEGFCDSGVGLLASWYLLCHSFHVINNP